MRLKRRLLLTKLVKIIMFATTYLEAQNRRMIISNLVTKSVVLCRIELQTKLEPPRLIDKFWIPNWIGEWIPKGGTIREAIGVGLR